MNCFDESLYEPAEIGREKNVLHIGGGKYLYLRSNILLNDRSELREKYVGWNLATATGQVISCEATGKIEGQCLKAILCAELGKPHIVGAPGPAQAQPALVVYVESLDFDLRRNPHGVEYDR